MSKIEKIEDFYKRKLGWVPDDLHQQIGHFNVMKLDPFIGENSEPVPYVRRDFYKIMLVKGKGTVHYADRSIELKRQALSFSNPKIPYKWENTDQIESGYFCIFNDAFFSHFGNITQYAVFHTQGNHLFELTDEQVEKVTQIFQQMFSEIQSSYIYKFDLLKALAFELIHFGMKLEPQSHLEKPPVNASQRITNLFFDLLERQFPINETHNKLHFRSASEFAKQLNIHANHLNRAVKETTQKTTSQVIAERILNEAKIMLKESDQNISEIAYGLGFTEASHFNHFFKKHTELSPSKFRSTL